MKRLTLAAILTVVLCGCRAADWADVTTLGGHAQIECYSGGKLIYEGTSDGQVANEGQSDGFQFRDAVTNKLVIVSGNCVIKY